MPTKRELLLCFAAYLFIRSFAFAQSIPLPPAAEQLSAWNVSYPEWSESWETALDRCGIDDPTLYRVIRLDGGAESANIRSANKQIQELDRRIVDDLKKHG